jgi:hypothetical protein
MEEERTHALEMAEEEAQAPEAQAEAPRWRALSSSWENGIALSASFLREEGLQSSASFLQARTALQKPCCGWKKTATLLLLRARRGP